jgi:NitT/TauT family transport system permease protein
VSAIAVRAPREPRIALARRGLVRAVTFVLVLAVLWGLWEGYRALWSHEHWTWPFTVDNTTMPHLYDVFAALVRPSQSGGGALGILLWHSALFTAKEAAVGFALGASVGFGLGILLAHSRIAQRGLLPFVVASQTIPILAIAPIVVIYLGTLHVTAWFSVAVIAAYLTFFPVTINTLRGLTSADRRAIELMRSYAAGRWAILWKLRVPAALPYIFAALKVSATASVVGAIIGEAPSSIQGGLGGEIVVFNQYYGLDPTKLWATNVVAAMVGIAFFLVVLAAERLIVRRAPENVA